MDATQERMLSENEKQEEEAFHFGMELISGSVLPMVLKAAIELDVFEIMAKEEAGVLLSAEDIASRIPYSDRNPAAATMLDRMLRLLASHSILSCSLSDHIRVYGLTLVCKFLTKNSYGVSLAPLSLMNQDPVLMQSWYHLKDAVLEGGIPFNRAYGMSAFEYPGTDGRFNKVFNKGMSDHSTLTMKMILQTYKGFDGLTSIVDVGGGTGAILNMIISTYPSIRGINFDLPHVIQDALPYQGVEHVGGDMFEAVPKGDAIFMKWICHDWSDEHCLRLLKNCHAALPEDGKVIIAECILPELPDNSGSTKCVMQIDLIMLAHNPGGKERTKAEFESLAKGAGFAGIRLVCCTFNTWVMEFFKQYT